MSRRYVRMFVVVGAAIFVSAAAFILRRQQDAAAPRQPVLARLVAKNYRQLTRSQSHRLVLYARAEHDCLIEQGLTVTTPIASSTRITMRIPAKTAREIVRYQMLCDSAVGAPPANATLQARMEQVLVYLPRWCLLHPTERSKS